jgi:glycosyltransferase involved in cell wall biosynthesis
MNILAISSILPVPGVIKHNDFVFQTYKYYNRLYPDDKIVIIKPVKYDFNLAHLIRKTSRLARLGKDRSRTINDFPVEIFPFLSSWGYRNLHALLTRSVLYLNRKRIKKLFSLYHFDVIHAQYLFPDGMLACMLGKKYNIPYFVTTHHERYYFDHFLSRKTGRWIMENAVAVLPLSHTNASYYRSIGIKNIELLPLGFSKSFLRSPKTRSQDPVSIFTAAELIRLKNIDKVLQAIRLLVPRHNLKYTVIGTGAEKENLQNLAKDLSLSAYVTFIDHIPHESIADEMYRHDIFIMPSYFETFGRVYFEAMAMGIPVICAKNSGIYGFFREYEEGLSVDHDNINEIAASLEYLISRPEERIRIGSNGRKLVQQYTWENVAEMLHDHYSLNKTHAHHVSSGN